MIQSGLIHKLKRGDKKALARSISIVENNLEGSVDLLSQTKANTSVEVIGITGPPGAGKSTLIDALITFYLKEGKKIGVLAVDPSSPFHQGSLLGDRIRMSGHYNNENVFIRSLATRGSLGGLSAKAIEVLDVMCCSDFDIILIETVGVGQAEVEIAGLADTTVLVLVPEAGDDVQFIKSGIIEIADIFVVNKADRSGADEMVKNLHSSIAHGNDNWIPPIIKCIASQSSGIDDIISKLKDHRKKVNDNSRKVMLYTEKIYHLIQQAKMSKITKASIRKKVEQKLQSGDTFNIYSLAGTFK